MAESGSPEGVMAGAARVRNPFERALVHRLHTPICSPGMCKIYKEQRNGTFRWEIEQQTAIMPADIVACNSQFEPSPDPALDRIAEEATEKFFSQGLVMPSPLMQTSKKVKPLMTSHDGSSRSCCTDQSVKIMRDGLLPHIKNTLQFTASAQTILTLPPQLPPQLEAILEKYCTYTQDQNQSSSSEYEISANGSLRRKLLFEEHSDMEHYDSEQTDDELNSEEPSAAVVYETHAPMVFSPDLSRDMVSKGMKRTFGTPLNRVPGKKPGYRNKIFDGVDIGEPCFSPIELRGTPGTPVRSEHTGSSITSSISPVAKMMSSDDEKQNFTSPESEVMAICLNCVSNSKDNKRRSCYCKVPSGKSLLTRSSSMKESPARHRRRTGSLSGKRSLSMSSLNRSRSVQKLDFSLDMSIDGSLHGEHLRCHSVLAGSESSDSSPKDKRHWKAFKGPVKTDSEVHLYKTDMHSEDHHTIDETPIKGKCKANVLTHGISQIRSGKPIPYICSPMSMSLDNSIESNHSLDIEEENKKIDLNNIDLERLTSTHFDFSRNATKTTGAVSFKRMDSGFNENTTFYGSKASYYESAIKPSELTVTDITKSSCNGSKALKEISNINWMRVDSGFKDETSSDNVQYYNNPEGVEKAKFCFVEERLRGDDKENNVIIEDFDNFLVRASAREEAMSISDIFADEMAMSCKFSSTPSKNKVRR